jgi:hypothetical protein
MYASFSVATAQIEMHCVERVFGDNNKHWIVVSSSATYESMQVLPSEHCKKEHSVLIFTSSFALCSEQCSLDVTHVYEPKETIPIVFFKYGEQKPNIN